MHPALTIRQAGLSLAITLLLVSCDGGAGEYSGDGSIIDNGRGSFRPRYVLRLPDIELTCGAESRFMLTGLPRGAWEVKLFLPGVEHAVDPAMHRTWGRLERAGVSASAVLTCDRDVQVEASGLLAGDWYTTKGVKVEGSRTAFTHTNLEFNRRRCQEGPTLTLAFRCDDNLDERVMFMPVLLGGGRDAS